MRTEENSYFAGTLGAKTLIPSDGCVLNAHIGAAAAIATAKMVHKHRKMISQTGTATSATQAIHLVVGAAGTVVDVKAGSIVACTGNATVTVDVKKNGTTILTGVITLDNANTARVAEAGTLAVTAVAAGDLLEIVVTATVGSGALATGLFVSLEVDETAV